MSQQSPAAPKPLPADVEALLDALKRKAQKHEDMALTDTDFAIIPGLFWGETLQVIGDRLGLKKQSVARRRGVIQASLQLYYLSDTLDGEALETYKHLYLRIRGNP